ncbi:MAG: imidazole glycerol phosphate synthase subunit HisF [Clostridiales Family XIII bacterium]|jgi:cyclase|nr:imidazole glycerol phosphate synthase subunit HisF [Clostridiales Family XIII bacterium]
MLAKRIIPCLDVHAGKVVKGVNFIDITEVGDPVVCAMEYDRQRADEIVFLDITATHEGRSTMIDVVRRTAKNVFVPLTVGGGIRTADDFRDMLRAGADKISVNSAAVYNPALISEAAEKFGSQCVVLAIDGKRTGTFEDPADPRFGKGRFSVYTEGGRKDTALDVVMWARKGESLGAGEILLTSMDTDGTKSGFDLDMLSDVCAAVSIPVIASGGGGDLASFSELFEKTPADAALAASVFHYGTYTVDDIKVECRAHGIPVR